MEPQFLGLIATASAAFGAFVIYFLFVRESKPDLILYNSDLGVLGLNNCGREVSHIFTIKRTKRMAKADKLLEDAQGNRDKIRDECSELQTDIDRRVEALDEIEKTINKQTTKGKHAVQLQTHLTPLLNELTNSLLNLSATLDELSFESAKCRFFIRVSRGGDKPKVMSHMITKESGQKVYDLKLAEFLEASNKTIISSSATLGRVTESWVEPINKD